jgi:hypothetical protein
MLKPSHPQHFDFTRAIVDCWASRIYRVDVEDPYNSAIQERMVRVIIVIGQNHYVPVRRIRVNGILFSANVVGGIVHTKDVVQKHAILLEKQSSGV